MRKVLLVLMMSALAAVTLAANGGSESDELVWVWYPNESTPEFAESRAAVIELASAALGREITEQLTTDYA
ncbi:MAG: hypothetical protein PQJ60_06915, partial [Spirochaetales bacterium]|nr:hypothetical protein [Spirochaetales bacterium]